MLGDPAVLIMDEPFNGMDPEGIIWMRSLLRTLAAEGRAILVSSHLMSELQDVADHVVVVGRGRVLADARLDELVARASGDEVVIRTPAPTEAARVLRRADAAATTTDADTVSVSGLGAQRVVEILGAARRSVLRGDRAAGDARGRLPPAHRRRDRVPRRLGRGGAPMSATGASPRRPTSRRATATAPVLRAEWTKFRTVRGWLDRRCARVGLCVVFTFLQANGSHSGFCAGPPAPGSGPNSPGSGCRRRSSVRPDRSGRRGGRRRLRLPPPPLSGNGTITARVASLTGVTSTNPANVAPSLAHQPRPGGLGEGRASCSPRAPRRAPPTPR